ncbi:MAG: hypothetical protein IJ604_10935 [Prevotella sp.]|nr:hypothetical protein [Prevotella sp.]MBR1463869.1 hypothetical protein [Prevotella sp.]
MRYNIDIKEDELLAMGGGILDTLLLDRTTGENIIWATDDYAVLGDAYTFHQHILPELITGKNLDVIQPRVAKKEEERRSRSRKMAEVFTPSWVCNNMNNGVDEKWFKRKPVFNVVSTEGGRHSWTPTTKKVTFPEGKTWQEYVSMGVIEITCGEAPFLASRYDTVTGEAIMDLNRRIGWLDRKLRIVNENTTTREEWLYWAKMAFKGTLGYEWQGDNINILGRLKRCTTMTKYSEFILQEREVCYRSKRATVDEVVDIFMSDHPTEEELDRHPNYYLAGIVYDNGETETVPITKLMPLRHVSDLSERELKELRKKTRFGGFFYNVYANSFGVDKYELADVADSYLEAIENGAEFPEEGDTPENFAYYCLYLIN